MEALSVLHSLNFTYTQLFTLMTSSDVTSLPNDIFVLMMTSRERFLTLLYADQAVYVSCVLNYKLS